jgi:uncharacterized membrane protein
MAQKKRPFFKAIYYEIQSIFLSGLFTILPLTLTVALCTFSFKLLKSWLMPIYAIEPIYLKKIPHSEILLVIAVIFLIGLILRLFLLQPIIHGIEAILSKIPLLRQIYFGFKQLVHALSAQDKLSFQTVVFIEFPRPGIYSLGFLTGQLHTALLPIKEEIFYNVFIPTTPNPTTGYYVIVGQKDIIETTLTRQEAMAIIISGGIIQPERFQK